MHFICYYESHCDALLQSVRNQINKSFEILVHVEKMNDPLLVNTYYYSAVIFQFFVLIN